MSAPVMRKTIDTMQARGRQQRPFEHAEADHPHARAALVLVERVQGLLVDAEAADDGERAEPGHHHPRDDRQRQLPVAVDAGERAVGEHVRRVGEELARPRSARSTRGWKSSNTLPTASAPVTQAIRRTAIAAMAVASADAAMGRLRSRRPTASTILSRRPPLGQARPACGGQRVGRYCKLALRMSLRAQNTAVRRRVQSFARRFAAVYSALVGPARDVDPVRSGPAPRATGLPLAARAARGRLRHSLHGDLARSERAARLPGGDRRAACSRPGSGWSSSTTSRSTTTTCPTWSGCAG